MARTPSVEDLERGGSCLLGARCAGDTHQPRHGVGARCQQQLAAVCPGDRCQRHLHDASGLPHRHPRCARRAHSGRSDFRDGWGGTHQRRPNNVAGGDGGTADRDRIHGLRRLHRLSRPGRVCDDGGDGRRRLGSAATPPSTPTAASRFFGRSSPFRAGSPISLPLSSDATTSRRRSASRCLRQSSAVSSPTSNWALSLAARGEPKFHRRVHCATGRVADGRRCRSRSGSRHARGRRGVVSADSPADQCLGRGASGRSSSSSERRRLLQRRQSGRVGDRPA